MNLLKEEYAILEQKCSSVKTQRVSNKIKTELNNLKAEYEELQNKYNVVVSENEEFKRIFDEVESNIDIDE